MSGDVRCHNCNEPIEWYENHSHDCPWIETMRLLDHECNTFTGNTHCQDCGREFTAHERGAT